jgi:hypothetical protein
MHPLRTALEDAVGCRVGGKQHGAITPLRTSEAALFLLSQARLVAPPFLGCFAPPSVTVGTLARPPAPRLPGAAGPVWRSVALRASRAPDKRHHSWSAWRTNSFSTGAGPRAASSWVMRASASRSDGSRASWPRQACSIRSIRRGLAPLLHGCLSVGVHHTRPRGTTGGTP